MTAARAARTIGVLVLAVSLPGLAAGAAAAHPRPGSRLVVTEARVLLHVPGARHTSGYDVVVDRAPFRITTRRAGATVLRTTAAGGSDAAPLGPAVFHTARGWATATRVTGVSAHDGAVTLTVATTLPGDTVRYRIAPAVDRYRATWQVRGTTAADQVATHYDLASAGHWYGHGETQTPAGGPYTDQPWPLDSGVVADDAMGPAEYLMTDPFWFTQRGSGLWVDTERVMHVSLNADHAGVFGAAVTDTDTMDVTTFVERTARDVYLDYVGVAGTPRQSDATPAQYAEPLWNTWAQDYTAVTQASVLAYARGLHDAGVPGHTVQIDDGWSTHYGDFAFNAKFPDPAGLSRAVHDLGYDFGLWTTLWVNDDADNYRYAADHGYLLKSADDPGTTCSVQWWNGTAGIVDIANPAARTWYVGQLHRLQEAYGVDGFKFDTRFFDESCAPYPGHTALDYIKLGAQLTDEFDQQGAGVRISWTGSQRYGFVTREIDKGTDWQSLQAAVSQDMAISTIGYPFVETDMIGGSEGQPPATKEVLVRWAQAASLLPLMYASTSPLGVSNQAGSRAYDTETVALYAAAVRLHRRLAPYLDRQVTRAVATGEPIMKPLFFDFPRDAASYTVADEWLLGDSLLAAPVLTPGTSRSVHLPPGRWYDVLRGRVVTGGTIAHYRATLAETPLFVRLGTADTRALTARLTTR
ncbi:Glycosyl hydrolases family 31 [Jatrophihabitans endophyticus]|uniref:Glycosyl hydrolases family 31 n=1 Tax=Jatrophihabitans endophyticus TaxID=1206085 RepID=A0A1M5DHK8_9ACTN|nr:glycoside hydrolase family 31 protein [Jatrophihabitans endophyticus]SHF66467.1 Glycosyl hydrolases family 31 [Jatrophihabitans endophyticus]